MRWFFHLAAAAALALPAAGSAQERTSREREPPSLRLCNKSAGEIQVAKAEMAGAQKAGKPLVRSEGWYVLEPGECILLYGPSAAARYYYYFAEEIDGGGAWKGTYPICVSDEPFTIVDTQCEEGYKRRFFNRVDMEGKVGTHTVNLTD